MNELAQDKHLPMGAHMMSGPDRVEHFHHRMGLPVREAPSGWHDEPSVEERLLRGRLMLEEFREFIEDGLGLNLVVHDGIDEVGGMEIVLRCYGNRKYDPIETADGLADIKVIANGTAVQFGIPMESIDLEVFASNMSKLDENGKPVVNRCHFSTCADGAFGDCHNESHLIDSTKPAGKLLKPDTYMPAQIQELYNRSKPNAQSNPSQ